MNTPTSNSAVSLAEIGARIDANTKTIAEGKARHVAVSAELHDIRIETSADVFFATDEIAVRALERFHVELMATDALAVVQLAAS